MRKIHLKFVEDSESALTLMVSVSGAFMLFAFVVAVCAILGGV